MGRVRRRSRVAACAWLAASAFVVAGGRARGGDEDEAIRRGVELRRAGDDEGALREFQKAYGLRRSPRAAGQLGFAEQALGRWADADTHVTEALHAEKDPWVIKNRETIDQALGIIKNHIGRIEISSDVIGATLIVAGRPAGAVPLAGPVKVSAGNVDIRMEAPGHPPAIREVKVAPGEYLRVVMSFEPAGLVPAAPAIDPGAAGASGPPGLTARAANEPASSERPLYRRPWFWGVVVGVVVAGTATAFVIANPSATYPRVDAHANGN